MLHERDVMAIKQEVPDELLKDYKNPEGLLFDDGIFKALKGTSGTCVMRGTCRPVGCKAYGSRGLPNASQVRQQYNGHGIKRVTDEDCDMMIAVP